MVATRSYGQATRWITAGVFFLIATLVVLGLSVSRSQGQQDTKWTFSTTPTTVVEGSDVNVTLNVPTAPTNDVIAYLGYSPTPGGSPRGLPFLADPPDSVTIAAGETSASIAIPTVADGKINAPDTFSVSVIHIEATSPDSYTNDDRPEPQELIIYNADQAALLIEGITGVALNEDDIPRLRSQTIDLVLDTPVETELSVDWGITLGSGVTPEDINVTGDKPLIFGANSPADTRRSITIEWADDTIAEETEHIDFGITTVTPADTTFPIGDITFTTELQRIHVNPSDQPGDIPTDLRKLHYCETATIPDTEPAETGMQCWGDNTYGQLGDGTTTTRYTPVWVSNSDNTGPLSGVTNFSTGFQHTCAVVAGDVYCWGRNNFFQLGQLDTAPHLLPTEVEAGLSRKNIHQVAAGGLHTCARSNALLHCWGLNNDGQAAGTQRNNAFVHPRIIQQPFSEPYPSFYTRGMNRIVAGGFHTCIMTSSEYRCFGRGSEGQLGRASQSGTNSITPNQSVWHVTSGYTLDTIVAGLFHSCGIGTSGVVLCWGSNQFGQLGSGTIGRNLSNNGPPEPSNSNTANQINAGGISGTTRISNAKAVSAGDNHTCIIGSDDRVRCWGGNDYGQLGVDSVRDGTSTLSSPYTRINVGQEAVTPSGTIITRIEAGSFGTCAWSASDRFCWGLNSRGSVGKGVHRGFSAVPVQVSGVSGATAVVGGAEHTCVLMGADSAVSCWGSNNRGQLAHAGAVSSLAPVELKVTRVAVSASTTSTTVVAVDHVSAISVGPDGSHTCAVVDDSANSINEVVCWGANRRHQANPTLDPDADVHRLRNVVGPTVIDWGVSGESYRDVAVGDSHSCVLVVLDSGNDEVRCWGGNDAGQVGVSEVSVADDAATPNVDERAYQVLEATVARPKTYVVPPVVSGYAADRVGSVGEVDMPSMLAAGGFSSCVLADEHSYRIRFGEDGVTSVTVPRGATGSTVPTSPSGDGMVGEVVCWGDVMANSDFQVSGWYQVSVRDRGGFFEPCFPSDAVCTGVSSGLPEVVPAAVLSDLSSVVVGGKHGCAVQSAGGEVFCWGNNDYGQLAYDLPVGWSSGFGQKVLVSDGRRDGDDAALANVGEVAAGQHHTCGLIVNENQPGDGDVYCWGDNSYGQLGNIRVQALWSDRAVKVEGLPGPVAAIGAGRDHSCAVIESDGAVFCWGDSSLGQTGSSSIISGADDPLPAVSFGFDLPSGGVSFERSVWQQVQMPRVLGGNIQDVTYRVVEEVSGQDQIYTFPEGLQFDSDALTIAGTPAFGLAAPVALTYQALSAPDQQTPIIEIDFNLNISGAVEGQAPTVVSPISGGYAEGDGFLLVTESGTHTVDLTRVFSDAQTSGFCTGAQTAAGDGCVDFAHTVSDADVASVTLDEATNVLTVVKGTVKGDTVVTVTATDADGNATSDSFRVRYNTPPVLAAGFRDVLAELIHYDHDVADLDLNLSAVFEDAENDLLDITFAYTGDGTPPVTRTVYEAPEGWRLLADSAVLGGPHDLQVCATDISGTGQQICAETRLQVVEPLSLEWVTPTTQTQIDGQDVTVAFLEFTEGVAAAIQLPAASGGVGDLAYTFTDLAGFAFDPASRTLSSSATTGSLVRADGRFTYRVSDSRSYRSGDDCDTDQSCEQLTGIVIAGESTSGFGWAGSQTHLDVKAGQPVDILLPEATKADGTVTGYCFSLDTACPDTIPGVSVSQDGLTFDPATRTITGVPNAGTSNTQVVLFAADDNGDLISLPFSYQITENIPPVILTDTYNVLPAGPAAVYDFTAAGNLFDPDSTMFTCTVIEDGTDLTDNVAFTADTVTGCNPTFGPGPDGLGTDIFTVTVTDASGDPATATFTVANNTAPTIAPDVDTDIRRALISGDYIITDVKTLFTDPDSGDTLTPTVTSPTTAVITLDPVTHTLTIPAPVTAQTYTIAICVTDTFQAQTCLNLNLDWIVNTQPQILIGSLTQTELSVATGATLTVDLTQPRYVSNPDRDDLDCTISRDPADTELNTDLSQDNCSLTFTPNPQNGWGPDTFSLSVTDNITAAVAADFIVYHNNPPVIASGVSLTQGRKFETGDFIIEDIASLFDDPDTGTGDALTYTKTDFTPSDLSHTYDPATRRLAIPVPTDTNPQINTVRFCAQDTITAEVCATIEVRWAENNLPDIKFGELDPAELAITTGSGMLTFDLTDNRYVEDVDGDTITGCRLETADMGNNDDHITGTINETDCTVTFTAGTGGFGSAEFTVSVEDGTGTPVSQTVTIWQSAAPTLEGAANMVFTETVTIKTSDNPQTVDLTPRFDDADIASGDTLTYSVEEPSSGLTHELVPPDNNQLRITPPDTAGTGQIDLCATDLASLKTCGTLNLNFPDNQPPALKTGTPDPVTISVIHGKTTTIDITTYYEDTDNPNDELSWVVNTITGPTDPTDETVATVTADPNNAAVLNITGLREGSTRYRIAASDGTDTSSDHNLTIEVGPNSPPARKTGTPDPITETVAIGGSRQILATEYFQDSDTPEDLRWEVTPIADGTNNTNTAIATAEVNTTNPSLLNIAGIADGSTSYMVAVSDGITPTENIRMLITTVTNNPPTIREGAAFPDAITLSHSTTRNIDVDDIFEDSDNDTLAWIVTPITSTPTETGTVETVATATLNPTDPTVLIITGKTAGTSKYNLTVDDGNVTIQTQPIEITVTNQTPTVVSGNENDPINVPLTRGATRNLNIADYYTDPDDNQLTWTITPNTQTDTNIATAEVDTTNNGLIRISTLTDGTTQYDLTASDGVNTTPTRQLVITVTAPTPPPTGGGGPPGGNIPGGTPTGGNTPTQPAAPTGDNPFGDDDGNTHEANINLLAQMGISRGCNPPANTRFCPDRAVTRGEMATFMVRAFTLADTTNNLFDDDNGTTHEANINRLATAEITRGCNPPENSRYCPQRPVTRAQMATFIARALNLDEGSGNFTDTANTVHANDINRIAAVGITRGCNPPTNTRYCPERPVTRAEMATFLIRATDLTTS